MLGSLRSSFYRLVGVLMVAVASISPMVVLAEDAGKTKKAVDGNGGSTDFKFTVDFDRIFCPKGFSAKNDKFNTPPSLPFSVLRNGEPPVDGVFDINGKAEPVVCKSTNPRVILVPQQKNKSQPGAFVYGNWGFLVMAPGHTTVSVRVGTWVERKKIEVAEVPVEIGMTVDEILKKYGVPEFKQRTQEITSANETFQIGTGDMLWRYAKWPRWGIAVDDRVRGIVTISEEPSRSDFRIRPFAR